MSMRERKIGRKKEKRHAIFVAALLAGVILALAVGGVMAQAGITVEVDADDVVKITRIVNYKGADGTEHPGAKMNIIVFRKRP